MAIDEAGNRADDSISVTVEGGLEDLEPPTVELLSPEDGETIGTSTTLLASATDNYGVTEVIFYVDDTLIESVSTPPYQVQ